MTLTEALNTKRGYELISSIEEAEAEIRDRGLDLSDTSEFWVNARQLDVEALKAELGVKWE